MSAINEWTEWHLTPRGWEQGTEKTDFASSTKIVAPPSDRVLTCRYYEYLSSVFSAVDKGVNEIWRSSQEKLIKELLQKFGSCPTEL